MQLGDNGRQPAMCVADTCLVPGLGHGGGDTPNKGPALPALGLSRKKGNEKAGLSGVLRYCDH